MANVSLWPDYSQRLSDNEETTKKIFDEQGYIKEKKFISVKELDVIKAQLHGYSQGLTSLPPESVFFEDKSRPEETLIHLERMQQHSEFFNALSESPVFNGLADVLLGSKSEARNVQYFSKPPGAKATPPHQDGKYFMHGQGITFWLALDTADEENGCLYYVPGSHKFGELEHRKTDQLGFSQSLREFPVSMESVEEKQVAPAGTLLAHHPHTVHRAGENRSVTQWRPALGFTYWATKCREDAQLQKRQNEYQSRLVEELRRGNRI